MNFPSDLEIAENASIQHIKEIAQKINIDDDDLEYYGKHKAKIPLSYIDEEKVDP
ncbi:MAG: formate--tetrahydrofolate ligase, partial [Chryseobacterium sp.]|nr:formate--tetrahydrofolate ligase [Chryseobacterium sp.]